MLDLRLYFKCHIPYIVNKIDIACWALYPLINRKSFLNISNKRIILKIIFHAIMFYEAPLWANSARCHIKNLQIAENKVLKMMYNLPWWYSTNSLHSLADVELVAVKLNRLTQNFNAKCLNSEFSHIYELGSL